MKPIKRLQIGKKGLTKEFILQVKSVFKNEDTLKITILRSACRNKKDAEEMAEELINALGKNYNYRLIGYVLAIRKFRKKVR